MVCFPWRELVVAVLGAMCLTVSGCGGDGSSEDLSTSAPVLSPAPTQSPLAVPEATTIATFEWPWGLAVMPNGIMLVTERAAGQMRVVTPAGNVSAPLKGVPNVFNIGHGGLLDVVLDPFFSVNRTLYFSYTEIGGDGAGVVLSSATLSVDMSALENVKTLWRQDPRAAGNDVQFGGRIAVTASGMIYLTVGDRSSAPLAQSLSSYLGKIIRIKKDGAIPVDNPFVNTPGAKPEIWTFGHRNPLGLVEYAGQLWEHEMGPMGGDEVNLIEAGKNYGWPAVSNGSNYDGSDIPDHSAIDGFAPPSISWNPVIAPAGMIYYTGSMFPQWSGKILIGGLKSLGLVVVNVSNLKSAIEEERVGFGARVREVEQGVDGSVWLLEDGPSGRLRRIAPSSN
jgi:glucose/arabinose dehydrogenase